MTIENADDFASYLIPQIELAKKQQSLTQKSIQYKQAGLDFISSCKLMSTNEETGDIDVELFKETLLSAIEFVQRYHDEI